MAYMGRSPFGKNFISINHSRLYRQKKKGYQPDGTWWQKLLATVIAPLLVVGIFALIFWWGTQ